MSQNENINTSIEIDPDYKSNNDAIRNIELKEEEDKQLTEEKIKNILQQQFDKELQERQKQLEEIEEKIFKAQKLLHIVRYVLISSYYNDKAQEQEKEGFNSLDYTNIVTDQNRIHPAVKKLLGNNVNNFKFLSSRAKRRIPNKSDQTLAEQPVTKKLKTEKDVPVKIECTEESVEGQSSINQEIVTQRNKVQHKVVIGNISYFKKSLEQDNLTHKWMVFVKIFRGTKTGEEVSNVIISKVVFYLHPSYKPHDVVEVSQPPYHLSRRGWGEFPLKVQIFFKSTRNKPVEIIHNLKLDKTFTERQTLGNETEETIFLYDEILPETKSSSITCTVTAYTDSVKQGQSTSSEHDYCYENVNDKNSDVKDHAYSLPYSMEGQKSPIKKQKSPIKQPYNEMIYGLGMNYLDPNKSRSRRSRAKVNNASDKGPKNVCKVLKTVTGQSIKFLPESFSQILLNNGNILSIKFLKQQVPNQGHLAKQSEQSESLIKDVIRQQKYLLKLPSHSFKCMGEVLPYLFKRLPLWTSEATNDSYKSSYPFSACSKQEYESWNIGKKLAAEWSRAKTIKRILANQSYSKNWTTKAILMYGRSHLYTLNTISYTLFRSESLEKQLILNCFKSNVLNGHSNYISRNNEENINVTSPVKEPHEIQRHGVDASDKTVAQECIYIKEVALDVGVLLKPEEIVKGVTFNASERVILEAVKCFAENLIRRSRNFLICSGNYSENNGVITTEEIKKALAERKEFSLINKFKESKLSMDFFS
ncbi:hypothetical protein GWI33_002636 [Rhynchophorus ferrugineus]|uniref:YEATS domain-containing protein n=1 Tax=Rhynchophorus ferrugineus TaxID=354439 RepID=A0A834IQZ0_RHYFE|nr:hypothetical protein GWI33_002636 [Rhynchophorus ferrugineus]